MANKIDGVVPSDKAVALFGQIIKKAYGELMSQLTSVDVTHRTRRVRLLNNIEETAKELNLDVRAWATVTVPAFYEQGMFVANKDLFDGGSDIRIRQSFATFHRQAVEAITNDTLARIGEGITGLTRTGQKAISVSAQRMIDLQMGKNIVTGSDLRTIRNEIKDVLQNDGIVALIDKGGRAWDLKDYSAMLARTKLTQAHNSGTKNRMQESGYDLGFVSAHLSSCALCLPYQGRVLSISGRNNAYTSLDEAEANGLFHPNCRHTFTPYHARFLDQSVVWDAEKQEYRPFNDVFGSAKVDMPKQPNYTRSLLQNDANPFADRTVWRAVDSTNKASALGNGTYFTFDKANAEMYGSIVKPFHIDPTVKYLDLNKSSDFEKFILDAQRAFKDELVSQSLSLGDERALANIMTKYAKQQGYNVIIGQDNPYGFVVMDSKYINQGVASIPVALKQYQQAFESGNVALMQSLRDANPTDSRFSLHLRYANPVESTQTFKDVLSKHEAQLQSMGIANVPDFYKALERGDKPLMKKIAHSQSKGDMKDAMLRIIDLL